ATAHMGSARPVSFAPTELHHHQGHDPIDCQITPTLLPFRCPDGSPDTGRSFINGSPRNSAKIADIEHSPNLSRRLSAEQKHRPPLVWRVK
ncbi:hypothetical protein, partial [Sphingomonas sp. LaA6.9]|uniref:hypothetical protein n=1 Tax=Sphingomonas sp. LaA6.9 TaxID=2919914 RepID=UPI001F4F1D62